MLGTFLRAALSISMLAFAYEVLRKETYSSVNKATLMANKLLETAKISVNSRTKLFFMAGSTPRATAAENRHGY